MRALRPSCVRAAQPANGRARAHQVLSTSRRISATRHSPWDWSPDCCSLAPRQPLASILYERPCTVKCFPPTRLSPFSCLNRQTVTNCFDTGESLGDLQLALWVLTSCPMCLTPGVPGHLGGGGGGILSYFHNINFQFLFCLFLSSKEDSNEQALIERCIWGLSEAFPQFIDD